MLGLSRELIEHRRPIKVSFRPYKQGAQNFKPEIIWRVKEEVDRLLQARFTQPCHYADWVSNIVPVEKKTRGRYGCAWTLETTTEPLQRTSTRCPLPICLLIAHEVTR
jgi:hypothetical protein